MFIFGLYQIAFPQLNISYLIHSSSFSSSRSFEGKQAAVIAPNLNVRSAPSMNGPIAAVIPQGTPVTILDANLPWVRIAVRGKDGVLMSGYVRGDFLGVVECLIFEDGSPRKKLVLTAPQCYALGGVVPWPG